MTRVQLSKLELGLEKHHRIRLRIEQSMLGRFHLKSGRPIPHKQVIAEPFPTDIHVDRVGTGHQILIRHFDTQAITAWLQFIQPEILLIAIH